MSGGMAIGGIIGGIVGWLIPGVGPIIGAVIGMAIGSYIDPVKADTDTPAAPKPTELQFAYAQEGSVVPVLLGIREIGMTIVDIAGEYNIAIEEEVETGGKGGSNTEKFTSGYEYYGSFIAVLCMGPTDELYCIYKDDKCVWADGATRSSADGDGKTSILIDDVGNADIYWGTATQNAPSTFYGLSDADSDYQVAYRNQMIIVFNAVKFGENINRVPSFRFVVRAHPSVNNMNNSNRNINDDYNPAQAVYYYLDNLSNFPTDWIDTTLMNAAAVVYNSETRGISPFLNTTATTINVLDGILAHTQSILIPSAEGKYYLKPLRADVSVDDMETLTNDDFLSDPQIDITSWVDVVNEVKVQYARRPSETPPPCTAVWAGGSAGGGIISMDYENMYSAGSAADFGDMTQDGQGTSACSNGSGNRGVIHMGLGSGGVAGCDDLCYINISSPGNASDWGDLLYHDPGNWWVHCLPLYNQYTYKDASTSNGTSNTGIFIGGAPQGLGGGQDYYWCDNYSTVNLASVGNWGYGGTLHWPRNGHWAVSNGVLGWFIAGGGWGADPDIFPNACNDGRYTSVHFNISYMEGQTVMGVGSAYWGEMEQGRAGSSATSNKEYGRGIICSGAVPPGADYVNNIDYIRLTLGIGDSSDFGDLTAGRYTSAAASSGVRNRAIICGGQGADGGGNGGLRDDEDRVSISTNSNAVEWGDMNVDRQWHAGMSNA